MRECDGRRKRLWLDQASLRARAPVASDSAFGRPPRRGPETRAPDGSRIGHSSFGSEFRSCRIDQLNEWGHDARRDAVACAVCLSAPNIWAEPFAPSDVTILLKPPEYSVAAASAGSQLLSSDRCPRRRDRCQFGHVADPAGVHGIDVDLLDARRAQLHLTAIRLDAGAPGLSTAFQAFGRAPQIREARAAGDFRRCSSRGQGDEAVHLTYLFGKPASRPDCPSRVDPDIKAFAPGVGRIARAEGEASRVRRHYGWCATRRSTGTARSWSPGPAGSGSLGWPARSAMPPATPTEPSSITGCRASSLISSSRVATAASTGCSARSPAWVF